MQRYTLDGESTEFFYSGSDLIGVYRNNTMVERYVFAGTDKPLVAYYGSTVSHINREYLYSDRRGSIVAAVDNAGSVNYVNTYNEFGVPSEMNEGRFGYTGQVNLPGLDLQYYKARIYFPRLGRFLQTDPIGYADGMNLYAYVGNDPLNFVDPSGLCEKATTSQGQYESSGTQGNEGQSGCDEEEGYGCETSSAATCHDGPPQYLDDSSHSQGISFTLSGGAAQTFVSAFDGFSATEAIDSGYRCSSCPAATMSGPPVSGVIPHPGLLMRWGMISPSGKFKGDHLEKLFRENRYDKDELVKLLQLAKRSLRQRRDEYSQAGNMKDAGHAIRIRNERKLVEKIERAILSL